MFYPTFSCSEEVGYIVLLGEVLEMIFWLAELMSLAGTKWSMTMAILSFNEDPFFILHHL